MKAILKTKLFKNSSFGIISSVTQNLFISIFFVIIARCYSKDDFANYIIVNTIYSFLVGFSSLGLGHWFIRELLNRNFDEEFLFKFFKMQFIIGCLFYFVSIIMTILLYKDPMIRNFSVLMSINIIFDNLIYVIKNLNIAEQNQKKTFILTLVESVIKCILAVCLFFYLIPVYYLILILLLIRFFTLNLFIKYGSSDKLNLRQVIMYNVKFVEIRNIITANWSFVIMGTLSVIYWRLGNIIVSKVLTKNDIANYEISFKLLSIAFVLPTILSTTIYPMLIKAFNNGIDALKSLFSTIYLPYSAYGILAYSFVCSYADFFIPLLFGNKFGNTAVYCREMFMIILIFPTFLLQAELLITMKLEKLDMVCNVISIAVNLILILTGLHFYKSLSVINFSIFISIFIFHVVQDVILIRKKIVSISHVLLFYFTVISIILLYNFNQLIINKRLIFIFIFIIMSVFFYIKNPMKNITK